jgi:hypothetical protein
MVYDTVTDMISGMPGNLIPLQLSQYVGGDTRMYCILPQFQCGMRFPDTPSTCRKLNISHNTMKKGGGMQKYENPGFWPVSTSLRQSIGGIVTSELA